MNLEGIVAFLSGNSAFAPPAVFGLIILAGLNIPISIDVLLVFSALASATIMPHMLWPLYIAFILGCLVSAAIPYCIGRFLGHKRESIPLLRKVLSEERLVKLSLFYKKYGFWTFLVGRFIPFGVRNGFFMSQGISKTPYKKFLLYDGVACTIWVTLFFFSLYFLGQNFDSVLSSLKILNLVIFSLFVVACLAFWSCKRLFKKR